MGFASETSSTWRYPHLLLSAGACSCSCMVCGSRKALSSKPALPRCCFRSMGQTDGRTPVRYIDPAPHTMRAASITHNILNMSHNTILRNINVSVKLAIVWTRSSAIAEGPRDASCQLKSFQLPRNSIETTCTTSPDHIDVMKLEV